MQSRHFAAIAWRGLILRTPDPPQRSVLRRNGCAWASFWKESGAGGSEGRARHFQGRTWRTGAQLALANPLTFLTPQTGHTQRTRPIETGGLGVASSNL